MNQLVINVNHHISNKFLFSACLQLERSTILQGDIDEAKLTSRPRWQGDKCAPRLFILPLQVEAMLQRQSGWECQPPV
jgi:hypothetical protein